MKVQAAVAAIYCNYEVCYQRLQQKSDDVLNWRVREAVEQSPNAFYRVDYAGQLAESAGPLGATITKRACKTQICCVSNWIWSRQDCLHWRATRFSTACALERARTSRLSRPLAGRSSINNIYAFGTIYKISNLPGQDIHSTNFAKVSKTCFLIVVEADDKL